MAIEKRFGKAAEFNVSIVYYSLPSSQSKNRRTFPLLNENAQYPIDSSRCPQDSILPVRMQAVAREKEEATATSLPLFCVVPGSRRIRTLVLFPARCMPSPSPPCGTPLSLEAKSL